MAINSNIIKTKPYFLNLTIVKKVDIPMNTGSVVIYPSLHVKLYYKNSSILFPERFQECYSCRLFKNLPKNTSRFTLKVMQKTESL